MLLQDSNFTRALVFANGDLNDGPAVQEALRHVPDALIIAADGGARVAAACGLVPDVVVGDMDSLQTQEVEALRGRGVTINRYSSKKDETDLELALLAAVARQANWIRVLGAWGGERIDQMLANIYLLMLREIAGKDVALVSGRQTVWLATPGAHDVRGAAGDTLSLIALVPGVTDVTTDGLMYPLKHETLAFGPARGVSNVMEGTTAQVAFASGIMLVVHTLGRA
ncbi:MAG TPA: thiamine diphosphokinase [Aggregatilineaceae bacterium]|nr:thiamine diphosphokinase [Aggregatilineaceae bacterium]